MSKCNENCFSIIDSANSKFALKIKEGMHTKWSNPRIILNEEVNSLFFSICVCRKECIQNLKKILFVYELSHTHTIL